MPTLRAGALSRMDPKLLEAAREAASAPSQSFHVAQWSMPGAGSGGGGSGGEPQDVPGDTHMDYQEVGLDLPGSPRTNMLLIGGIAVVGLGLALWILKS